MSNKLKVYITDMQKDLAIPTGIRLLIRKCCHAVLRNEEMDGSFEVSVSFVGKEQIRELNKNYRGIDKETDVLSFPASEEGKFDVNKETGAVMLGDIAISVPHVYAQAEEYGHSLQREFAFLTVHSMLHVLGYDHEKDGLESVRMREREEKILSLLGLNRDESYVSFNA